MGKGVRGVPLRDRPIATPGLAPAASPARRRHCWVQGPPEAPGQHPGLVLDWSKRDGGWMALVAYLVEGDEPSPVLVQQWVSAALLEPA